MAICAECKQSIKIEMRLPEGVNDPASYLSMAPLRDVQHPVLVCGCKESTEINDSRPIAKGFLFAIKQEFEENEKLKLIVSNWQYELKQMVRSVLAP